MENAGTSIYLTNDEEGGESPEIIDKGATVMKSHDSKKSIYNVDFDSHNVTRHDMRLLDSHRKKGRVVVNSDDEVSDENEP